MTQPTLFDLTDPRGSYGQPTNPIVHANDPASSREAAERHVASGKWGRHLEIVVQLVRLYRGSTADELYHSATAEIRAELGDHYEVRRRLTDAKARGLVVATGQRRCRVRGTTMTTWEATP